MSDLKPCPFCGGEADFAVKDWDNSADEYKVVCLQCGTQQADYSFNKDFVIEAWNRRVSE